MNAVGARPQAHEGFLRHRRFRWLKVALSLSALALLVYLIDDPVPRPSGGTAYGYTLGTIAALLILWLTMLGVRKRAITPGRWSLKAWTSAHVYLGLSLVVIGTLHTGFQFGWDVHTLAYALMLLVIASGIAGISLYAALPRVLSDNRGEMTETQMLSALVALDRQIDAAAQPLDPAEAMMVRAALAEHPVGSGFVTRLRGRYRDGATARALADLVASRGRSDALVSLLERRQALVGRVRRHLHLKALLEAWLFVHVPTTFALIAALIAHIVAVFFYW